MIERQRNEFAARRTTRRLVAGLATVGLAGTMSSCGIKPGSGYDHLPAQLKVQGTSNGPQHAEATLNCNTIIIYNEKGEVVEQRPGTPRQIVYDAGTEPRTWGAETTIVFGVVRLEDGGSKVDKTGLHTMKAWMAVDYRGHDHSLVTYAYGAGPLPDGWDSKPFLPYNPNKEGFPMLNINDPYASRYSAVLRQPAYVKHGDADLTAYETVMANCGSDGPIALKDIRRVYVADQIYTQPNAPVGPLHPEPKS